MASPPRRRTAAISITRSGPGRRPVVSVSSTTKSMASSASISSCSMPCAPPIEIERVSDAQVVRPLSLTICVAPPHHHTQSERRRREKTNAPEIRHTRIRSYVRAYHERSRLTSHQEIWQGDVMLARSGGQGGGCPLAGRGVSPPRLFLSGVGWGALHSSGDMG